MKRLCIAFAGLAMILPAGCQSHGSGSTAPSNNPDKPTAVRKLTVKAPGMEKSIRQNGTLDVNISVSRDNFMGPVAIEMRDLPAGVTVTSQDLTIPAEKDSLKVGLRAAADAKIENEHKVHVAARAKDQKDMKEDVADFKLDIKPKE